MQPVDSFSPLHPKIVLGVAAHPDDLDFGMSGTIAKWTADGAEAYYLVLTDGSKGSADKGISSSELVETRRKEQKADAEILGVRDVFFLDYEDGALMCDLNVKKDIARVIRQTKPDVILTFDPTMIYSSQRGIINHPDHRAAGQATLDACFPLARDHLTFPEFLDSGLEPHVTHTVLLMNFDRANYYEDISGSIDKKMKALAAHKSQMLDTEDTRSMIRDFAKEAADENHFE